MKSDLQPFDMTRHPISCRWFLKPVAWLIALPGFLRHRPVVTKEGVKGLKPPYLLLGNHNAFFDMKVSAMVTFPHFGNYVVAIDGFIGREGLLRSIGCICKRKFTNDLNVVRHIRYVIQNKGIAAIYPEARYSLCGTTAPLPAALGKLCKMLKVPVVTVICHGHHINHPFWNTKHERNVKHTEVNVKLLLTPEQLAAMSVEEINQALVREFRYDDFKWQYENKVEVACVDRAEGLQKILYQCPNCGKEFEMTASGDTLKCNACGKEWIMDVYGRLSAKEGETEFPHIPDWYEWERDNVRKEVENGTYSTGILPVQVDSLPNAKGYIDLGEGTLCHDMNGFRVELVNADGSKLVMEKPASSLYSCHVEYDYLFKKGDCVDLNTLDDTWYIYPHDCKFSVTKMALATEELYFDHCRKIGKPCPPGIA